MVMREDEGRVRDEGRMSKMQVWSFLTPWLKYWMYRIASCSCQTTIVIPLQIFCD